MQNNKLLGLGIISPVLILFFMGKHYFVILSYGSLSKTQHLNSSTSDNSTISDQLFLTYFGDLNDATRNGRAPTYAPSFEGLHTLLFGATAPNIYKAWPNYYQKKADWNYPHTHLLQPQFHNILKQADVPITFAIEVGSFTGRSAITIVHTLLDNEFWSKSVLLCIDTWVGSLDHWLNGDFRPMLGLAYGRPTVYEQFLANIIDKNFTSYIIPFSTTSILGARFLFYNKLTPQVVYLDSAHLKGETYVEVQLYWFIIQPGGVLVGDDWGWLTVRSDVLLFAEHNNVNVSVIEETWSIKKPVSS